MKAWITMAAVMVVAGTASAHEGMHGPGAEFDADESGDLSLAEYTAYLKQAGKDATRAAEQFAALDRNKNGALSSAEFVRGLEAKPK